jgi:hypothetical protein
MRNIFDIETSPPPKNTRILLLELLGPMDEEDENGNISKRDIYETNWVVGHVDSVFGICTYPIKNICTNQRFTHWCHLPDKSSVDKIVLKKAKMRKIPASVQSLVNLLGAEILPNEKIKIGDWYTTKIKKGPSILKGPHILKCHVVGVDTIYSIDGYVNKSHECFKIKF